MVSWSWEVNLERLKAVFCNHVAWDHMDSLGSRFPLGWLTSLRLLRLPLQHWENWILFTVLQIIQSLCNHSRHHQDGNGIIQSQIACGGLLETAIPTAPCFAKQLSAGPLAAVATSPTEEQLWGKVLKPAIPQLLYLGEEKRKTCTLRFSLINGVLLRSCCKIGL